MKWAVEGEFNSDVGGELTVTIAGSSFTLKLSPEHVNGYLAQFLPLLLEQLGKGK